MDNNYTFINPPMKSFKQISSQIGYFKGKLNELNEKYYNLSQIDMLSDIGNQLLKDIYCLKGKINALQWVIKQNNYDVEI